MSSFSFIDIHSHVNFAAFDSDREEVIQRAQKAGIVVVNVGTQKDTSQKAVELAEKYPEGVYACIGIHPIHSDKSFHDEKELGKITPTEDGSAPFKKGRIKSGGFLSRGEIYDSFFYSELAKHPKVVAIGECGLDYYRVKISDLRFKESEGYKKQEENFRKQIELAKEVRKPLMLHLRNGSGRSAYRDAFSILQSYNLSAYGGSPPDARPHDAVGRGRAGASGGKSAPGNLHFFAGSIEEARPFLDAGFTFSFTGVITFTRDYDEIIRYLPLDRILSETDSPYVAPEPYRSKPPDPARGRRNEPLFVVEVVKRLAAIRNVPLEDTAVQIRENAARLFGFSFA